MAVIAEWNELTVPDKIQLFGKISHLLMNDKDAFRALTSMVRTADIARVFDNVVINPETNNELT